MKFTLFNDTAKDWTLHIGSVQAAGGATRIPRRTSVEFEVEGNHAVFIKVWDEAVMVRATQTNGNQP